MNHKINKSSFPIYKAFIYVLQIKAANPLVNEIKC